MMFCRFLAEIYTPQYLLYGFWTVDKKYGFLLQKFIYLYVPLRKNSATFYCSYASPTPVPKYMNRTDMYARPNFRAFMGYKINRSPSLEYMMKLYTRWLNLSVSSLYHYRTPLPSKNSSWVMCILKGKSVLLYCMEVWNPYSPEFLIILIWETMKNPGNVGSVSCIVMFQIWV